jgi:adenine-specific DNA-methyltransferase
MNVGSIRFHLRNRRYLGNKAKLLEFIDSIVKKKCGVYTSFFDIFAGTGVVGDYFNTPKVKIISNDILYSNYTPLKAFLGTGKVDMAAIEKKIAKLNALKPKGENYFSKHFGGTYFSPTNARKIGAIREEIERISKDESEKAILITSLLYAVDKVANTVGHYDAFRKTLDSVKPLQLQVPMIEAKKNTGNQIYQEDANVLIRKVKADVLYLDPPYNSRQYSDAYHLLENLAVWNKPELHGKAKKMDRTHLKSKYCLSSAPEAFADLIENADCKHILVSYNNTSDSKDGRSNARITDEQILKALKKRGKVEIFEQTYKAFTAGKSKGDGHTERLFYCRVI